MSYIQVEHLRKSFIVRKKREKGSLLREKSRIDALSDLSFEIGKGELVGYIGPNGAGKSTTVKILSGILTPDSGNVLVGGRIPWASRKEYVRHIGVVFGQRMQLWWDVPILDSFSLLRDIYRIPETAYQKRLAELTDALQLGNILRTPLRLLSLGQRMRAELCGSLLHRPELLFLDEPTIGLDSISKLSLREFLRWENRENGTTILLTTHDMEDIHALCSRVMVLGHGRKLFDGDFSALLSRYDTVRTVIVRFEEETELPGIPSVAVSREGESLKLVYSLKELPTAELLEKLRQAGTIR
ncbi:MAG: ATP-binding cassette domain-containing protein, partial [Clostridia bacterium]|nr:ATP-binding cassette domain-containing protein [Clostridia bacterium]